MAIRVNYLNRNFGSWFNPLRFKWTVNIILWLTLALNRRLSTRELRVCKTNKKLTYRILQTEKITYTIAKAFLLFNSRFNSIDKIHYNESATMNRDSEFESAILPFINCRFKSKSWKRYQFIWIEGINHHIVKFKTIIIVMHDFAATL